MCLSSFIEVPLRRVLFRSYEKNKKPDDNVYVAKTKSVCVILKLKKKINQLF